MNLKILQIKPENNNAFSLVLEKPKDFQFYAGQYLDIELSIKDSHKRTRAFTISSSPSEDFLMITFKKGASEYKKYMENLKTGNTIKTSHPAGTFTLDESTPAIFLAGGIGITPFRSIIKYASDEKITTPVTLIYSNSDSDFPFKKELDLWGESLGNLKIIYVNTSKNGRLTDLPQTNQQQSIYYLAGSHGFVDGFEKILLDSEVDQVNIRYDRFDGYD